MYIFLAIGLVIADALNTQWSSNSSTKGRHNHKQNKKMKRYGDSSKFQKHETNLPQDLMLAASGKLTSYVTDNCV